jgi:hypothetical protein
LRCVRAPYAITSWPLFRRTIRGAIDCMERF